LLAKKFKFLIADESHFLRNEDASRTKYFTALAMKAPHVLQLSGTPAHAPSSVYSQLKALQPNLFPPYWITPPHQINTQEKWRQHDYELPCTFGGRWCDPQPEMLGYAGRYAWTLNGGARLSELNAILNAFCILKRCKEDVLKELPEKIRLPIHFDVPMEDRHIIQKEMEAIKGLRQSKPYEYKKRFMAMWNDLPRIKTLAVQEYLTTLFTTGDLSPKVDPLKKVLIFAHHRTMIDVIEDVVKKNQLKYIKITGSTPTASRQQLVDTFNSDKETRVAILSLTAAGFGLNLQSASLSIFCEIFFGPDVMVQAEDRTHRLGQTAPKVVCRYLVAKDTLDEGMVRMVSRKATTGSMMLLGRKSTFAMKRAEKLSLSTDEDGEEPEIITDEQLEEEALEQLLHEPTLDIDTISNATPTPTPTSNTPTLPAKSL
jgi:SWI/SNF-related matrix-associated actin-dependent regulator 1 of chromatin subfamily A